MFKIVLISSLLFCSTAYAKTIEVNRKAHLLTFTDDAGTKTVFKVAVGKSSTKTPSMIKTITEKRKNPVWHPPADIRRHTNLPSVVLAGPHNPLGSRALNLGSTLYRIHGTNSPSSIGKSVSHGCIRMKNKDIEYLYDKVDVGTKVIIK